jgi:hypothetical protein
VGRVASVGLVGKGKRVSVGRTYTYFQDESHYLVEEVIEGDPPVLVEFEVCEGNGKSKNEALRGTKGMGLSTE